MDKTLLNFLSMLTHGDTVVISDSFQEIGRWTTEEIFNAITTDIDEVIVDD